MGKLRVEFEPATKLATSLSEIAGKLADIKKLIETSGSTLESNWPDSSKGLYGANLKALLAEIDAIATLYQDCSSKVSTTVANYINLLEKYKIGG